MWGGVDCTINRIKQNDENSHILLEKNISIPLDHRNPAKRISKSVLMMGSLLKMQSYAHCTSQ